MKTSKNDVKAPEFTVVDPLLFGVSFNNVDIALRGGVYAIRPSRSGVNPQTGLPTHGVYCIWDMEILDGDFAGEIRKRSYYVGGLAGSIPKGSPPQVLLVPSADGKTFVGGLTSEDVIQLALGTATFGEDEYADYEGKYLLQPSGRNMPLREDSQYGQFVTSIKNLYKPGKNATAQEIAYGTSFPGILAGNKGPDFAKDYGFHVRLEESGGDGFKTLVAVAALGPIEPRKVGEAATSAAAAATVTQPEAGNGYTAETVKPLIYKVLAKGPHSKNEVITALMNMDIEGNKDSLITALLSPAAFDSPAWVAGADGKFVLA